MAWFGAALEGITGLGSQWLENKAKVRDAEFGLKLAKLEAKTKAAATIQEKTFNLDELAVREAAKTWWDEGLCAVYLFPYIYTVIVYPFWSAGDLVEPAVIWDAIRHTPDWYKWGLVLIGVRYLGFRNLLRNAMAAYKGKGFFSKGDSNAKG